MEGAWVDSRHPHPDGDRSAARARPDGQPGWCHARRRGLRRRGVSLPKLRGARRVVGLVNAIVSTAKMETARSTLASTQLPSFDMLLRATQGPCATPMARTS